MKEHILIEKIKTLNRFIPLFSGTLFFIGLYLSSLYSYLLFHSLVEMFSIIVAFSIFVLTWNSRKLLDNNYLLFIGISCLFSGSLDLVHTLAYKGMGVFQGYDTNLPTQLWIAFRYVLSLSFLIAAFFTKRKINFSIEFIGYSLITFFLLGSIFYWEIFPVCFIEGFGLTTFKITSEYIISLIFLFSLMFLLKKHEFFDRRVLRLLSLSILSSIFSELFFTQYVSVYAPSNMAGHYFELTSFYFMYKAIIETGLVEPYNLLFRNLKQSRDAIQKERDKSQKYLDIAGVMIVVIDAEEKVGLINKKGCEILGYPENEIIGKKWFDTFVPERLRSDTKTAFKKIIAGEIKPVEYFENSVLTRGGEERIIAWHNSLLRDEKGNIIASLSSGEDITESKRIEKKIAHLASFPQLNPNPVIEVDSKGTITFFNSATVEILKKLGLNKDAGIFLPGDLIEILKSLGCGKETQTLCRMVKIKDRVFSENIYASKALNAIRIYATDVTERELAKEGLEKANYELETRVRERTAELRQINKELEQEITERREIQNYIIFSNALLKLLSEITSRKEYLDEVVKLISDWSGCRCAGIRILHENGNIPYESYVGFSKEFWESENWLSVKHDQCVCIRVITGHAKPQDAPAMTAYGSFCSNNTFKFVSGLSIEEQASFRGVCLRNGFASVAVIPIRYNEKIIAAVHLADEKEGKVPLKSIDFFEKITPLIGEAIHKLDAEVDRARLVAAVESSADATVITDADRIVQYVNPSFEQTTGYSKSEIVGKSLDILRSDKYDNAFYSAIWNSLKKGKVWSGRLTSRKKDGTFYEEDVTFSPVKDNSGNIHNYVAVKRDVTEKLRLESIAEAVNAMNSIGYIFAGIRHEIGNPVNSTKMTLNVLKKNLDKYEKPSISEYLERALGELSRIEYLLRNLKSFNMYEKPELQNMPVSAFMDKFLLLVKSDFSLKKKIEITASVEPDAKICYADPRALQQVLLNVFTNAADALEGRDNPKIDINILKLPDLILFRVTDNGPGITEKQLKDLFKPFYTTKKQGTGLGLVIVKRMLSNMNGFIEIMSGENAGTTVDIFIPEGQHEN